MAKYTRLTLLERGNDLNWASGQIWFSGESNYQTFNPFFPSGIPKYAYNWGIDGLDYNILPIAGRTENLLKDYGSISGIVADTGRIPQNLKDIGERRSNLHFEKMDSPPRHVNHKPTIHAIPAVGSISGGHISILTPSGLEWEWYYKTNV